MVTGVGGRAPVQGWLVAELMVAISLLGVAMIPLAFSFRGEQKLARTHYHQVVAMEIIDGEMEILHAGQWRAFAEGESVYATTARAATNLPPGEFVLTRTETLLRLEWRPAQRGAGGKMHRQTALPRLGTGTAGDPKGISKFLDRL